MSIREFKELVREVWGVDKCSVSCHLAKVVPMAVLFEQLKNTFIFTGKRSVVQWKDALNNVHSMPFDDYVCVYDIWMANANNSAITILGVKNQYNIWANGVFDSGTGKVIPDTSSTFPTAQWQRYYIIRYATTRILNFD